MNSPSRLWRGETSKTIDVSIFQPAAPLELEFVIVGCDGEGRLLALGFPLGRQVVLDHVVLDGPIAFEVKHLVSDAPQRGDAPQSSQAAMFLEFGDGGLDIQFHGGALERLGLGAYRRRVTSDDGIRIFQRPFGGQGSGRQNERYKDANLQ